MTPRQQIILLMRILRAIKEYKSLDVCHFILAVCQRYGYKPSTVRAALEWLQEHHIIRRGVVV